MRDKSMNSGTFYALSISDIQSVANENLQRSLNDDEIQAIIRLVERDMPWYEIIEEAINEYITDASKGTQ